MKFSQITCNTLLSATLMIVPGSAKSPPWKIGPCNNFVYKIEPCVTEYLGETRVIHKHGDDSRIHEKGEAYLCRKACAMKRTVIEETNDSSKYQYTIQFLKAMHYSNEDAEVEIESYTTFEIRSDKESYFHNWWDTMIKDGVEAQKSGFTYCKRIKLMLENWIRFDQFGMENSQWRYKGPHPKGQTMIHGDEGVELTFPSDIGWCHYSEERLTTTASIINGKINDNVLKIKFKNDMKVDEDTWSDVRDWTKEKQEEFDNDGGLEFWTKIDDILPCHQTLQELRSKIQKVKKITTFPGINEDETSESDETDSRHIEYFTAPFTGKKYESLPAADNETTDDNATDSGSSNGSMQSYDQEIRDMIQSALLPERSDRSFLPSANLDMKQRVEMLCKRLDHIEIEEAIKLVNDISQKIKRGEKVSEKEYKEAHDCVAEWEYLMS